MSRFNRVILAIAGGCLALGILICVIVGATGGWNVLANAASSHWEWSWGDENDADSYTEDENGVINDNDYTSINDTFDSDKIQSIDLDIAFGEVSIEQGEEFAISAENVLRGSFKESKIKDGVLIIKQEYDQHKLSFFGLRFYDDGQWNKRYKTPKIRITVPEDFKAEDFKLDFGAGKVEIASISAEYTSISLGAGDVRISELSADKIDIDSGVGNLIIRDAILNDLDLETGVGNVEVEGIITGSSSIDCGVGRVQLELKGNADDYDFDVDHGVGTVKLNDKKIDTDRSNGAKNSFSIEGGVGEVSIHIE